jgi:hypothetical protein
MIDSTVSVHYPEVAGLVRSLNLSYPISTPDGLVTQVVESGRSVVFRGEDYDSRFAASLLPAFCFPLANEEDLIAKTAELLMARGLLPLQPLPWSAPQVLGAASPLHHRDRAIDAIVSTLEQRIREGSTEGILDPEAVEALDAVTHALCFVEEPEGLSLWREALWNRRLVGPAKQALASMLEYLNKAVARGENDAVSQICDCLEVLLEPHFVASTTSRDDEPGRLQLGGEPGTVETEPTPACERPVGAGS